MQLELEAGDHIEQTAAAFQRPEEIRMLPGVDSAQLGIAIATGIAFEALTRTDVLPANPSARDLPDGFRFWSEASARLRGFRPDTEYVIETLIAGVKEARMVMRWILFGVLLASVVRTFAPADVFCRLFRPDSFGSLAATLAAATVLEVCSEGSTPIAADILNRAGAPGNSFAFLMGGVATDYTEIMVLRDTTSSWRVAMFLPLISLPQVVLFAWLVNLAASG